jgi:steroid 5-alpha reductase family enzyme
MLPVYYCAVFAHARSFADTRLNVMMALVFLWGARLTFNFACVEIANISSDGDSKASA